MTYPLTIEQYQAALALAAKALEDANETLLKAQQENARLRAALEKAWYYANETRGRLVEIVLSGSRLAAHKNALARLQALADEVHALCREHAV